jgi:hypothetical protein
MARIDWRRFFQFRLRTVMVFAAALSVGLAWFATRLHRGRQQRPVVEAIEQAGGRVWVVGELERKDAKALRLASLRSGGGPMFDSQRPDKAVLEQMVEDVKAGDAVCIAFTNGAMMNVLDEDGSTRPSIYGQESQLAGIGWVLHVDSRDPWSLRSRRPAADLQPFDYSSLAAFPDLQVLDLGTRLVEDDGLGQIARAAKLRALLARRAGVTDEGLAVIAQLKNLRVLSLDEGRITDRGLRHLAGLERLEVLELDHSQVRGSGLKHLAGLTNLKLLSLRGTPLEDAGLQEIGRLTSLRRLYCSDTRVTDAGLQCLRPLKNLEILHLGKTAVTFRAASEFEKDLPRSIIIR